MGQKTIPLAEAANAFLRRLKVSHSLLVSALLPLAAALVLSGLLISERTRTVQGMSAIRTLVEPLTLLNDLVHELQKERGMTAVFLTAEDASFLTDLQRQRQATDRKQARVDEFLATQDYSRIDAGWASMLAQVRAALERRVEIRGRVDRRRITKSEALDYYTGTNLLVLDLVKYTGRLSHDVSVGNALGAFAFYLQAKERAGIERAIGASGFAKGVFAQEDLERLHRLITLQETFFREFSALASQEQAAALNAVMRAPPSMAVQRMREQAMSGGLQGELGGYTSQQFFEAQTRKIDLLRTGEQALSRALLELVTGREDGARSQRGLLVATTFLVLVAVGALSLFLVRFISRGFDDVVGNAETMARGNLDISFPPPADNEFGRITESLKVFRDSIVQARLTEREARAKEAETRKERARERERAQAEKEAREAQERRRAEEIRARERLAAEEIARVVQCCGAGDFSQRLKVDDKEGIFAEICQGVNRISEVTQANLDLVQEALSALKRGDVSYRMTGQFSGVFVAIQEDLNAAFDALAAVIDQIGKSSENIHSSTHEISDASLSLAKRTETSAATLEEIAASIGELSKSVRLAAELATETNASILDIEQAAENSARTVDETINAIQGIREASETIGQTITMIDEIAFQTNLLALNAGVEAARAGESGRGFAVVASEVRDLAARSSDAAHKISSLIDNNQKQVTRGVEMVNQTGTALKLIARDISNISKGVHEIADSVSEQSNSIDEIRTATSQLDQVTQENAAMFEETTALSMALKVETDTLVEVMSRLQPHDAQALPPDRASDPDPAAASAGT